MGNRFEELEEQLRYTFNPDEREILLKAMVRKPEESTEERTKVVRKKEGVRARSLERVSKPSA